MFPQAQDLLWMTQSGPKLRLFSERRTRIAGCWIIQGLLSINSLLPEDLTRQFRRNGKGTSASGKIVDHFSSWIYILFHWRKLNIAGLPNA